MIIGLGGRSPSHQKTNKKNLENGQEYARFTETPYWNLMLDKQLLRIEERPMGHRLFIPQVVVHHEIWIGDLQKRHSYR